MPFSYYSLSHSSPAVYKIYDMAAGRKDGPFAGDLAHFNRFKSVNQSIPTLCVLEANLGTSGEVFVFEDLVANPSSSWRYVFYSGEVKFMEGLQEKYKRHPNVKFFAKGNGEASKYIKAAAKELDKMNDKTASVESIYTASPHRFDAATATGR